MDYIRPDIYQETVENTGVGNAEPYSTAISTPVFIGNFPRGKVGEPLLINNWTEFCNKIAYGLNSPFMENSYTSFCIYGFYQCHGSRAYVVRVVGKNAKKASLTQEGGATIEALDVGDWGNELSIEVTEEGTESIVKTLKVILYDEIVETFIDTFNADEEDLRILMNKVNSQSKFIKISGGSLLSTEPTALIGGSDDIEGITDEDYTGTLGLKSLNVINDFGLVAIPGQTSESVLQALINYCDGRNNCYPILDAPKNLSVQEIITYIEKIKGDKGAIYYPWQKITDPTSSQRAVKLIPPSGHVTGIYANTDKNRGVYKAPAGIEAKMTGVIGTEMALTPTERGLLNQNHINAIINKPRHGVVIFGARNINRTDKDKKFVTDIRFDMFVSNLCYEALEWVTFEPGGLDLCEKVHETLRDLLKNELYNKHYLKGQTEKEAFFVKCDKELNTNESLDNGFIIAEIGYANKKPNEFTIIRIKKQFNQA